MPTVKAAQIIRVGCDYFGKVLLTTTSLALAPQLVTSIDPSTFTYAKKALVWDVRTDSVDRFPIGH